MSWHAKPSGAYAPRSFEGTENIKAFYEATSALGYSKEATAGILGNVQQESGFNPWRWQSDKVNYSAGYGLFQYTPASGYLENYGKVQSEFAPNLSTSIQTAGALPTDAIAQIKAIQTSGKYSSGYPDTMYNVNRILNLGYTDWEDYQKISQFKTLTDVKKATAFWLCFFEKPADASETVLEARYEYAKTAYEILDGETPQPPSPPTPPSPTPVPTPVFKRRKMPVWLYTLRRR